MGKLGQWLQVGANTGILAGLILVGFQLAQNTELLRLQIINDTSRRTADHEYIFVGEQGAEAWATAIENPTELSFADQRILESLIWPVFEAWRNAHTLHSEGPF